MKRVQVTSMAHWVAEEFKDSLDTSEYEVKHDFGFDVPREIPYAWWLPLEHAYQVQRVSPIHLTATGSQWLSQLPFELLGRVIQTMPISSLESLTGTFWMKLAEAKSDQFIAGIHNVEKIKELNLPKGTQLQICDRVLDLDNEHRFYVVGGEIATGSTYLLNGKTWNDHPVVGDYSGAVKFAEYCVKELGNHQPHSYTLDVAYDKGNERWILLEGNPAWSSGFYGCDLTAVTEAIHESMKPSEHWKWSPDALIEARGTRKRLLVLER